MFDDDFSDQTKTGPVSTEKLIITIGIQEERARALAARFQADTMRGAPVEVHCYFGKWYTAVSPDALTREHFDSEGKKLGYNYPRPGQLIAVIVSNRLARTPLAEEVIRNLLLTNADGDPKYLVPNELGRLFDFAAHILMGRPAAS